MWAEKVSERGRLLAIGSLLHYALTVMKIPFAVFGATLLCASLHAYSDEPVRLDQEFRLRLEVPKNDKSGRLDVRTGARKRLEEEVRNPLTVPNEPLPPGSRAFKFNGNTHFYIPLRT